MDAVARGRSAYAERAWQDAFDALSEARASGPLGADDLERLALAAALVGREDTAIDVFEELHRVLLDAGEPKRAVRAGFWAAMRSLSLGDVARGSGWLARLARMADELGECAEIGYLRLPHGFRFTATGDHEGARRVAGEAAAIGERHGDRDLFTLARTFEGRALIRQGRIAEGLALLDEAMIDVTSGRLAPVVTGLVYCAVIAACQSSYALDRARDWTASLDRWCSAQPQLVVFAGACMIHRSEIRELEGAWSKATEEAKAASVRLGGSRDAKAGDALYRQGELHRLRGEVAEAERLYAAACERGRDPQPGLALLRLVQGRVDLALAASKRVLSTTTNPLERTRFLPAHVEIALSAADLVEARKAADELGAIAGELQLEVLGAIAQHAKGSVLLAEGDARGAIEPLRNARVVWQRVGAPYLDARIRLVLARAFAAVADEDGAALERAAARKVFEQLGAAPDLAALEAVGSVPAASSRTTKHGLSVREVEVLQLVATGKTNKVIAKELFLSEKTVDRHVSNIFAKLAVSTRAAATAWAHRNGLAG